MIFGFLANLRDFSMKAHFVQQEIFYIIFENDFLIFPIAQSAGREHTNLLFYFSFIFAG